MNKEIPAHSQFLKQNMSLLWASLAKETCESEKSSGNSAMLVLLMLVNDCTGLTGMCRRFALPSTVCSEFCIHGLEVGTRRTDDISCC